MQFINFFSEPFDLNCTFNLVNAIKPIRLIMYLVRFFALGARTEAPLNYLWKCHESFKTEHIVSQQGYLSTRKLIDIFCFAPMQIFCL